MQPLVGEIRQFKILSHQLEDEILLLMQTKVWRDKSALWLGGRILGPLRLHYSVLFEIIIGTCACLYKARIQSVVVEYNDQQFLALFLLEMKNYRSSW